MGFIKPNNNSGGSGGGLTPQELSRLNNAYTHSKSEHAPTTAEQNVQPDWNETDTTSDAYIKNKPDLSQVGSGEVDLSGYVTKETGNANQITFADGQTFQAKLDAGTLKGEKGDQGEQGIQGLKGDKGDKGEPGSTEANAITIADTANNFTANTVEGALAELFQSASNGKTLIAQAITGAGINATSNDTWQELATKISQILGSTVKINSLSKLSDCKFKLISSKSNTSYNSTAETAKNYDDSSWNNIRIPHDWSIYNSFNSSSPAGYEGGYLDGGDAWYRFKLKTSKLEGQKVYVYFDGIYMESDVYINGTKVKSNKWYNPFYVDITDYLEYDNADILTIFVRNQQPSSRWYSGSGIIRNAYLVSANDVEIGINDINITSPTLENDVKTNVANTKIDIKINSTTAKTVNLVNEIYFNNSLVKSNTTEVTLSVGSNSVTDNIQINNPTLWDEYEGNLYTLKTYVKVGGAIWHSLETKYGYRYFKFDKDTGFWLNGKNLKLRGVCMHHDLGCLGAEVNKSAIERQINLLIDMGVNAIRITHNPGSSEFLNVCAEKGILTIEEFFDCWTSSKKQYDFARYYNTYAQEVIENTINRDKNNPSIIMWSIGNEIIRTSSSYDSATATGFVQNMINWIKAIDTERMVTMGDDTPENSVSRDCMQLLDVVGVNYGSASEYASLRTAIPNKPIYGSETTSSLSSRGVYSRDDANKQCSSFDNDKVHWGEYASLELKKHMTDINYLAGMFVWTGFDYIGEPTPFNTYPCKSSYFGIYDTCGFPKDIMYMYQSRWTSNPMVHILPHWDWKSSNIKVWLYSNCYKVELFLNGTSLGEKLQTDIGSKYQFEYYVDYTKGTLVANGYNQNGDIVAQDIIYTSQGTASTTKLSTDKTSVDINSDDLVFITCDIVDRNGVIVPTANNKITFTVEGGTIVGTDNGDATCVEKYRTNVKSAFNGKVLCVVKHDGVSGNMVIKANGDGLTEQTITIVKNNKTVLFQKSEQSFIDATNPIIYDYSSNPTVPCTGIVLSVDTLSFTTTDTQTLEVVVSPSDTTDTIVWSAEPSGIVSVDNGVVTPIANGTCTITATCGTQSATCAVTVSGISEGGGDTGGYTDIGYIESTGTQYINTRIVPTASTKIELVAEMSASKQYDHIFGSDNFMKVQWMDDTGTAIYANKKNGQNQISGLTLGKHTYVMDMTDTSNVITIDGTKYGNIIGQVESTTNSLLLLCGYKTDGTIEAEYCGIGKIYSCKIYYEDTLVANMKPVLTNSGTYGLLDTVNNSFYGSEVGSFTGGGTPSGGDTGIYATAEYAITEPRAFNGTSDYIDTGIKLFDTAKTFTIFVDYASNTATPSNQATIFHCIHEVSPFRGLCLMKAQNDGSYFIGGQVNTLPNYTSNIPSNGKYLISFVNGVINNIVTVNNSNELVYSATDMASTNPYVQISENLLLGCYQDTSGTKGRYWKGTLNKFGVWFKQLTSDEINEVFGISGGGTTGGDTEPTSANLVFQVNSASMNTSDNTLTDNIAGISATLTGTPTVVNNNIMFTTSSYFVFDISSLNLTNSDITVRIKLTQASLTSQPKNILTIGNSNAQESWDNSNTVYCIDNNYRFQYGRAEELGANNTISDYTIGNFEQSNGSNFNKVQANIEQEIVMSINKSTKDIRIFIDGELVQNGKIFAIKDALYLGNHEGINRFVGGYSLIEIYNGYCNNYTEFTNMINNASSGGDTDTTLLYSLPEETTFNGSSTYIDTGVALLSTDQDFTIALDVTATEPQNNREATLLHCMHEERPWAGISIMSDDVSRGFYITKGNNSSSIGSYPYLIPLNTRTKVIITKEGTTLSAYSSNGITGTSNYTYTQVNENLLIGAYQTTSGDKGRYFSGTVHDFKIYNKAFTSEEKDAYLNIGTGTNASRVFKIDSTCMNTVDNTLTDNIAGISATLTGNPTVSGNQIVFTASDKFSFDISSLNLTSSNRTFRIKFTPTNLNNNPKNVMVFGTSANSWNTATTCYINSANFVLQHGSNNFTNVTTGSENGGLNSNRLSTAPVSGQEYELVISESTNGNVRWYIDGVLVQNGTTALFNPLYLSNAEGNSRFTGSYSLIEIYNEYCNDYTEFTNMINNASSGGDTDTTLLYSLPEETVFNGTSTYIDTGVALLSTDQDFTITMDVTATSPQVEEQATLYHCMHEESPYPGLSFMTSNADNGFYIPKGSNAGVVGKIPYLIPLNGRAKVVITKKGTTLSAYSTSGSTGSSNYTYTQVNENLLIGAYQTTSGAKGRYFLGTVHDFKIYNKVFTSQEKDTYLGINNN